MAVKNACVTFLFQILPFTDPKNLSYVKRTFFGQINRITKETFDTFLINASYTFGISIRLNKSLATFTSFSGVCYHTPSKPQV